jgi:hypothetical protein
MDHGISIVANETLKGTSPGGDSSMTVCNQILGSVLTLWTIGLLDKMG